MISRTLAEVSFRLHHTDNVVIARVDVESGPLVVGDSCIAIDSPVPRGHKIAASSISAGEPIRKYGQIIGFASTSIEPGEHVHTHNVAYREFERDYAFGTEVRPTQYVAATERATFEGYVRADGRVGTRNYIVVLTTVNCSATAAKMIADHFRLGALAEYENIDGVVALTHALGCGTAGRGNEGFETFRRTLTGYADHPNVAGLLVLGLGCEVNQVKDLVSDWELSPDKLMHTMAIQELGGTAKTVREGTGRVKEMLPEVNRHRRQTVPASELILGMECGGSDGYSGITANPALGAAADLLIQHGGTAVFGETTEIYGAEHLLTRRAISPEVGAKLIERIRWWEKHVQQDGSSINNNPSPGNKAGGLTTILEKSLGAAAKGGTTNLCDVVRYGERITAKGLVFMDTPGFDPVNATGLVAGGANVLCFTTGRGSVFGCKPVPSLKLATNTPLYERMTEDMDINCGVVADGECTVQQLGEEIFGKILDTASGSLTKSEELGFGEEEFVPWSLATTL
jgi:altronate hydrolase